MALDNRLVVYNEQGEPVDYDILASDVKFLPDGKDLPTKLAELEDEAGQGGYAPPAGGIPKTDLAQSVQDSLDKADSALQDEDLAGYATKTELQQGLGGKQDTINDLASIRTGAAAGATAVQPGTLDAAMATKQNVLTFDDAPTAGSDNPVKSKGVKTALDNLLANLRIVNNEWYIGNTATGVSAQGPAGNVNISDASQLVTILVNDLTTGGSGNILSAEMGKTLKVAISTLIDSMGEYCFPNGRPTLSFETPKWNVEQSLTHVDSDFTGIKVDKDGELTIHLTVQTYYALGSVVVKMGNVDVTNTYYTAATGTVYIPQVTGDVVITATAVDVILTLGYAKPENLVFMLDGLVQGGDASVWTDLVGRVVFTPTNGVTKVAKGWSFDGVDDYMTGDSNMGGFDPYTHTIEICYNCGSLNTTCFLFVDGEGKTIVNYLYNYQDNDWYVFRGTAYTDSHDPKGGSFALFARDNGHGVRIISHYAVSQGSDAGRLNGVIKQSAGLSNASSSGHPSVGARWKGSESRYVDFFAGTIHAIRVYNTQLTFAEMLANQKVDNERFELGLTLPNS